MHVNALEYAKDSWYASCHQQYHCSRGSHCNGRVTEPCNLGILPGHRYAICADSFEPSLLVYTKHECRRGFRLRIRHLVSLDTSPCAFNPSSRV